MNQQEILMRLKSIRERYNYPEDYAVLAKNVREEGCRSPMFDLNIKKCNSIEKESRRNMNPHYENEENGQEEMFNRKMSNSIGKTKELHRDSDHERPREMINKSDFSAFIKDLDKKIQSKERFLRQKLNFSSSKHENIRSPREVQNQEDNISPIKRKPLQMQNASIVNRQHSAKNLDNSSRSRPQINDMAALHQTPSITKLNRAIQDIIKQKPLRNLSDTNSNHTRSKYFNEPEIAQYRPKYVQQKCRKADNQRINNFIQNKLHNDSFKQRYPQKQNTSSYPHPLPSKQKYQSPYQAKANMALNDWTSNNFQKIQLKIKSALKATHR